MVLNSNLKFYNYFSFNVFFIIFFYVFQLNNGRPNFIYVM